MPRLNENLVRNNVSFSMSKKDIGMVDVLKGSASRSQFIRDLVQREFNRVIIGDDLNGFLDGTNKKSGRKRYS